MAAEDPAQSSPGDCHLLALRWMGSGQSNTQPPGKQETQEHGHDERGQQAGGSALRNGWQTPTPAPNAAQPCLFRNKLGACAFSTHHIACKATKNQASELLPAKAGFYIGVPNLLGYRTALWCAAGTTKGGLGDLLWQITPQRKSKQLLPSFKSQCTSPAAT